MQLSVELSEEENLKQFDFPPGKQADNVAGENTTHQKFELWRNFS